MPYYFYLDDMLLPVAPSKLQLKINSQNKTISLINDGEFNILKRPRLTDIEFEALIPQVNYPFTTYEGGFKRASYYLDKLEALKNSLQPFQFKVTRSMPDGSILFGNNMTVSLEEYKINEDSKAGFDLNVSISLKQFEEYGKKVTNIKTEEGKTSISLENARPARTAPQPKTSPKTYRVAAGDTLWFIAKKFYGDGSQYQKIFKSNRDKVRDPNLIFPGQVLTIPV